MSENFSDWVRSATRTQEELITVERITEIALPLWRQRHGLTVQDFPAAQAAEKERIHQRRHNPAYLPVLLDSTLDRTAEVLDEITEFKWGSDYRGEDRTPRALAPLRWLPRLETLIISCSELADPAVLASLQALRVLHLYDRLLDDAAPLGALRELRELHLSLDRPWPELGALAGLEQLETFVFHGNVLALEDVPALPQVKMASISGTGLAPRDLRRLPEMPLVRWLKVQPVFGLAGIERYPHVRTLRLSGPMEDLTPLAALREVTFAELQGDSFQDPAPLATLPKLQWLRFLTKRPRDYSVLAETPRLHEVEVIGCDIHDLELGALHAALDPWEVEWMLAEPRPLSAVPRFFYHNSVHFQPWWPQPDPADATWDGDEEMERAEQRWFQGRVHEATVHFFGDELPGKNRTGRFRETVSRMPTVVLEEWEEIERMPELLEVLRPLLTQTRFLHAINVQARMSVEKALGQEEERHWLDETKEERLARYEADQKKQREQMEREHRFQLRKADGATLDPEEFAAPPLDEDKVLVPAGAEIDEPQRKWETREDDPALEAFDPDAWRFDEDLGDWDLAVFFYVTLTAEAYLVMDIFAPAAQHYLRRRAEKLPEHVA